MAIRPSGARWAVPNDASGVATLVDRGQALHPTRIVLEATGGLERAVTSAWGIDGTLSWAKTIHDSLTGAQVSAWIWWGLALWGDGPPDQPSQDQFLVGLNYGDHSYAVSKTLWALGNFSKFIRPGFVRIGTTPSNTPMLHASAYKDPTDGQLVIVVINRSTSAQNVRFDPVGFRTGDLTRYVTSRTRNLQ